MYSCDVYVPLYYRYERGLLRPDSLAMSLHSFSQLPGMTLMDVMAEVNLFFVAGERMRVHWIL